MVIKTLLIIIIAYALGSVPLPSLICSRLPVKDKDAPAASTYPQVLRRHGWLGVGLVLAGDLLRALVIIFLGGLLLKGAGFPGVGRRLALLFALLGQLLPVTDYVRGRPRLVFPALLLLWLDWRLFLIALVVFAAVYVPTKRISVCVLAAALSFFLFTLILGAWWLQIVLVLLAAIVMVLPYRMSLIKFFSGLKRGKKPSEED